MKQDIVWSGAALIFLAACGEAADAPAPEPARTGVVQLAAGADLPAALQRALIEAEPGQTIEMPPGEFQFTDGLSLDVDGVTLVGAGEGATVLDFSGQMGAGEGLLVTSDDVTLSGFTMRDTAGDGIKSKGADRIVYRDLTVEWSREADPENGAYGVYPVESSDILIERVTVRGASDAGVYVGQSNNIIVRDSLAEYNVAGIEIENSTNADVYGNRAVHNAGGVLVFDLPDLPVVGGHSTRIFGNEIANNNTVNFAPPGTIVATVPSGTGVIILANENVHVFDNAFSNNRTGHVLLTAYQDAFADERYNPLPRKVVLRDNSYEGGGDDPQGLLAQVAPALGGQLPPIVWDGVDRWGDREPADVALTIQEDEAVGYVNLGFGAYPFDPEAISPTTDRPGTAEAVAEPEPVRLAHVQ